MKLAADFRQAAREALRGKWPIAILIGLVAVLLGGAGSGGPEVKFNYDVSSGVSTTFGYGDRRFTPQATVWTRSGADCSSAVWSISS